MKIPNFAVLSLCSLALAAPLAPAFAQAPPPPPMGGPMHGPMGRPMMGGPRGGGRMQRMADELGLTAAQKAKMKPILMSRRRQMMALRANTTLPQAARLAKMQSMRKSMTAQMMAILTPAQRTKLQAMRLEQRQAGAGPYGRMPRP